MGTRLPLSIPSCDGADHSSIPSGDGTVWADASPLIHAACDDLQDGELIHGENFSLFAAMSALEIMDPKMDSGMDTSGYQSIEDAIENGAAPIPFSLDRTIDVHCTIDVMDHLLACEATWHKGHSLAQTVFSCIYLLRIERISSHALLHSYCRIIRATCNAVISAVSDARTHEEEDLFTMAYGLPLKEDGNEKCLSILNSTEEAICRQFRACRAQSSTNKVTEDVDSLQRNPYLEEGYCRALLCRLRFRKHFYHVLMSMRKPQGRGLELAKKHIASCLAELASMYKTVDFLKSNAYKCSREDPDVTTASGCMPIGFDASINSRLMAPAPPRAIRMLCWKEAVHYFEKLLQDLDIICSYSMDPILENVKRFVVQFQRREPDLVARAYLQVWTEHLLLGYVLRLCRVSQTRMSVELDAFLPPTMNHTSFIYTRVAFGKPIHFIHQLLLVQDGKLYGKDLFHDVISRAISLPEVSRDQEFQKNEFVVQLVQLVVNLLKILCTNTAWQRRKLGKILQDWGFISIQLELALKREFGDLIIASTDENICITVSKHLFIWTEEQIYWIAARYLTLGFELELYSPSEYCMIYWYLYIVYMKLLEKMQLGISSRGENPRRKGKKKRDPTKDIGREAAVASSCMLIQCYTCLSEGLAMLLAALRNELEAFKMPSPFNTEEERFIQHLELLQKAHVPDHVSYFLFKESTGHACISNLVRHNYFKEVQKIATSLRGSFSSEPDRLEELRQLEQVAEQNRIAVNIINQIGVNDSSLKVSVALTHHPFFAVAVVRRS